MSDSESSEEIEVKVEQEQEAKVRELIERGKQITPFYDVKSTLFSKAPSSIYTKNHSLMTLSLSTNCKS